MLQLKKLSCGYAQDNKTIIDNFQQEVPEGSYICVIGRNGAGKSTLLRTLSGLQTPLSGEALIDAKSVHEMAPRTRAKTVSIVTTERVSAPGLTVQDVIELGRQPYTGWNSKLTVDDRQLISQIMDLMNITQFLGKPFAALSDGERQRVMISRALVQNSKIMIMDEITAFLDLPGRVEVMALLREHAHKARKIILLSSHDLELSLELADQVWIVNKGNVATGTAENSNIKQAIAQAFNSDNVKFDPVKRHFRLQQTAV